jgi:hypothetical protein
MKNLKNYKTDSHTSEDKAILKAQILIGKLLTVLAIIAIIISSTRAIQSVQEINLFLAYFFYLLVLIGVSIIGVFLIIEARNEL